MWCRRCSREVRVESGEKAPATCPFCGGNVEAVSSQSQAIRRAREILEKWQSTDLFDRINAAGSAADTERQAVAEARGLNWDPQIPAAFGKDSPLATANVQSTDAATGFDPNLPVPPAQASRVPVTAASIIRTIPPLPAEIFRSGQSTITTTDSVISAAAVKDHSCSGAASADDQRQIAEADAAAAADSAAADQVAPSSVQLTFNDALDLMFQSGELTLDQAGGDSAELESALTTAEAETNGSEHSLTTEFTETAEYTELPPGIQPQAVDVVENAIRHLADDGDCDAGADSPASRDPIGSSDFTDRLSESADVASATGSADEQQQSASDAACDAAAAEILLNDPDAASIGREHVGNEEPEPAVSELACHRQMLEQQLRDAAPSGASSDAGETCEDNAGDKSLPHAVSEWMDDSDAVSELPDDGCAAEDEQPLRILRMEHEGVQFAGRTAPLQVQPKSVIAVAATSESNSAMPGRGGIMTSIIGQTLAYIGVLGLTAGGCIVVYGHFGGHPDFTPTGWLVTMVSQMLLFLGVINLVTGGIEQSTQQLNSRMASMSDHIQRLEQMNRELLQQSSVSGSSRSADAGKQECHAESA